MISLFKKTALTVALIGVTSLASAFEVDNLPSKNAAQSSCTKTLTGTYLITILDPIKSFASRSLVTLIEDGNIIVGDSSQGGKVGKYDAFTTAQGNWACNGKQSITARLLNFSGGKSIARTDYVATFNPKTKALGGSIILGFFDLEDNPLDGVGDSGERFTFTGQRLIAQRGIPKSIRHQ
jgi:hypothetical protein